MHEVIQANPEFPPTIDLSLFSTYSNKSLMIHVKAMIKDPKQTEPKLYLIAHHNPLDREKSPSFSSSEVKNQLLTATIMTYLKKAQISSATQSRPTIYIIALILSS